MTSTDIVPFTYGDAQIRTITIDGDPWFVASDIAKLLGYRDAAAMTRRLDPDEQRYTNVSTSAGSRSVTVCNEAGFYEGIFGSQVPGARQIKRWLANDVMPSIRKTGSYGTPAPIAPPTRRELAMMVVEAEDRAELAEARVVELEPAAEVASRILDATGDLSVADTAQCLTRAGIKTGQRRLFSTLAAKGWIYRGRSDLRWRVYQDAIDAGYMSVIPMSHYHPRTGELVLDPSQPRITPRGMARILADHGRPALPETA